MHVGHFHCMKNELSHACSTVIFMKEVSHACCTVTFMYEEGTQSCMNQEQQQKLHSNIKQSQYTQEMASAR